MQDTASSPAPTPAEVQTDTSGTGTAQSGTRAGRPRGAGGDRPARGAARLSSLSGADAARLFASRRAGQRPPADVTQTAGVLLAALPVGALQAYMVWAALDAGVPDRFTASMWTLVVGAAVVGAALAGTAIPVRRAVPAPWWAARVLSAVALVGAAAALRLAAQLADTPLMLVGVLSALLAITANIALWSTEVRRWCGARDV
ncbi:hypothetical protein DFP74_0826 [Nocardiopsis sp. Huas11]|uniref:hypothetical protein n=1 Tax=Nocardiopsis sp. Huas11 TaxID=2183912 RepID=UPI000F155D70|nr:hypothetical protein [Nocardiopsis sp. Huas11]RKS05232.1 hypothetical protein DFP74_0826 [Nocardiopsis sp. Huas11]